MGHRHLFGTAQVFDMDHDQNQNHIPAEQPYVHLGRVGPPESGSVVFPVESISTTGVSSASEWNSALRSNEYPPSSLSMEAPHYRPAVGTATYDPYLQPSAVGSYCPASQNYNHASSSSYYRNTTHGVEGSVVSPTVGGGRGSRKRKSPMTSTVCERGSSSRYYGVGSSSDVSISTNVQQEKPILHPHPQNWVWDPTGMNSSYRGGGLSIGNEASQRNVRSRSTLDLEANLARTHLSSGVSCHPHSSGRPIDHSAMMDVAGLGVNATTQEWSHNPVSHAARGRIPALETGGLTHETNQFLGVCNGNGSVEIGGYQNGSILSRNPAIPPQNVHGNPTQAARSGRSSYYQRSTPAYRPSLSYPRFGHATNSSEDGLQFASETYSSRHLRPSAVGWRSNDRNGRFRMPYERFRSHPDEADAHDRLVSEGLMIVERSSLYGSRNLFDQHREMRLDVDNMSYEELLALGERIGTVGTGLSADMISKCLTETIYCSSDQIQEEGNCVICLEEYKDREEVGTLKNCSHDYHVDCIKKWLSMKNVCPICKAPALGDDLKDK